MYMLVKSWGDDLCLVVLFDFLVEVLGDFVQEPGLIVAAGHPGAGKTTLASYMCYCALQRN
jgi:predicted ATP-dependent serine protease